MVSVLLLFSICTNTWLWQSPTMHVQKKINENKLTKREF